MHLYGTFSNDMYLGPRLSSPPPRLVYGVITLHYSELGMTWVGIGLYCIVLETPPLYAN